MLMGGKPCSMNRKLSPANIFYVPRFTWKP